MLDSEPFLLQSVVLHIRQALQLDESQCNAEAVDDFVPQTSGEWYIAVTPEGLGPGPTHQTSATVSDIVFGVRVTVFRRTRDIPRDMRRSVFLDQVVGLNAKLDAILDVLDWNPSVTNTATLLIREQTPDALGFMNHLRFVSCDSKPQSVIGDPYGAHIESSMGTDNYVGLKRSIYFAGARRIEKK